MIYYLYSMRSKINFMKNNKIMFFLITFSFLFVTIISNLLDYVLNTSIIYMFAKTFLIVIFLGLIIIKNVKNNNKFPLKYVLISLIPILFNFIIYFTNIEIIDKKILIEGTFLILQTVILEELFFRMLAVKYFSLNNRITWTDFYLLALITAFFHSINMFFPLENIIFKVIYSFSISVFYLALYLKSKNILITILSHFISSFVIFTFTNFPKVNIIYSNFHYILFILSFITYVSLGIYICKKNDLLDYK